MGAPPRFMTYPMFRWLMVSATGIFLSDRFLSGTSCVGPLYGLSLLAVLVAAVFCLRGCSYGRRGCFGVAATVAFGCLGALAVQLAGEEEDLCARWPEGPAVWRGRVEETPVSRGGFRQAAVRVEAVYDAAASGWRPVRRRMLLAWKPGVPDREPVCGERGCFRAAVGRIPVSGGGAGRRYRVRTVRIWLSGGGWQPLPTVGTSAVVPEAWRWRAWIEGRFRQWGLPADRLALLQALTLGDRRGLSSEVVADYRAAGASHVLALSGLHVGVVALCVLGLFRPLRRWPVGRRLSGVAVVLCLWVYAFVTGWGVSVVRAVLMYTFYWMASSCGEGRGAGRYGCTLAAFALLLYQPSYLFDIAFQLSFAAVFAILLWLPWWERQMSGCWPVCRWAGSAVAVTCAAQAGTLPLVLYHFGTWPVYAVVSGLVVVPAAFLLVALTLAALLMAGVPLVEDVLVAGVSAVAGAMNRVTAVVGSWPGAQLTGVSVSGVQAAGLGLLLLSATAVLLRGPSAGRWIRLLLAAVLAGGAFTFCN